MPYTVGGKTFRTKSDVTKEASTIRDSVPLGGEITGTDRAWVLALLENHEERADKIRDGVTILGTMSNAFGTVSFKITRTDGTSDDFSIGTCVKGIQKSA